MTAWSRWTAFLDTLRGVAVSGIDHVEARLGQFSRDFRTAMLQSVAVLARTVATLLLAFLAAEFSGLALMVVFWDSHRVLASLLVAIFFISVAIWAVWGLRRAWNDIPQPFVATLELLDADRNSVRERQ